MKSACIVCDQPLLPGLRPWHRYCRGCGYEASALQPAINVDGAHEHVDEAARESGLRELRQQNFRRILEVLAGLTRPGPARLLDVGAAHGWFLELARLRFETLGIEPDRAVCAATLKLGLPVRAGYFPQALTDEERFDVIVFNDVIEHIPPIDQTLASCYAHLNESGLLVLNVPSSRGFYYRASKALARLSFGQFFSRMWQEGFPSPHVHYFAPSNLSRLVTACGFELVHSEGLKSVLTDGLYDRIAYSKGGRSMALLLTYFAVAATVPIIRLFPSDIELLVFRKRDR